jgi:hypothetical protein
MLMGRPEYEWGKVLNFNARGNALPYCVSGWGAPEAGLMWTDGLNARLSFTAKPPRSDVSLVITANPFVVKGRLPNQELHLYVNFLRVGFSVVRTLTELNFEIPKYVFQSPTVVIDLYIPKACSPNSLGTGKDQRELGLAVSRLMLAES